MSGRTLPFIGIPSCVRTFNERDFHTVNERYPNAVIDAAGCVPLVIPAIGPKIDCSAVLDGLDGLLLTGSPSNVEPFHYGGPPSQEGTLHQRIFEMPGRFNHRRRHRRHIATIPDDERYGPAHSVALTPEGLLARLAGATEIMVNSLHGQGIDRPAPDLLVEAVAPDGQIEAVSLPGARFVVGVQWHPEYKALENPFSRALFAAFSQACHATRAGSAAKRRAA